MLNRKLGSILLITGTCVGAGMLGLPISTANSGFPISIAFLVLACVTMWLTGLYVLETNLDLDDDANFISMARSTLGKPGEITAWISYLLLLYSLMAAYLTGGGDIVMQALGAGKFNLPHWFGPLPWVVIVGAIVFFGLRSVDTLNRILMIGLVLTFLFVTSQSFSHVELIKLTQTHSWNVGLALPVVTAAFGYHVIIPSLRKYNNSDVSKLKSIIFFGSLLSLVIYVVWEAVVFGTIPLTGDHSLATIQHSGHAASGLTNSLAAMTKSPVLVSVANAFVFFAIASSFVGISMAIFDFLADGFSIPKTIPGRLLLTLLTFIPPFVYALLYPKGFMLALSYAGVFVAILHGFLPAFMVWAGRKQRDTKPYKAPGGTPAILFVILFSVLVLLAELVGASTG